MTQVQAGHIRVIGGNVHQSVGAKLLRTDGDQAEYFAVVRRQDLAVTVAPIRPVRAAGRVGAGRAVVEQLRLLRGLAGRYPDLVVKWNDMADPSLVDIVVHLHGWANR